MGKSVAMIVGSRTFAVFVAALLLLPAIASAQTREQRISALMKTMDAIDFPVTRKEGFPAHAARRARSELEQAGVQLQLGPQWKAGNRYWDLAETALRKDIGGALNRQITSDLERQARVRQALRGLPDSQLDEMLRFYGSDLLRKALRYADLNMAMLFVALADMHVEEKQALHRAERLQAEAERYKLTMEEERQLEEQMRSPAFAELRRAKIGEVLGALTDPARLFEVQLSGSTVKYVGGLIAQFRDENKVAAPLPAAYDADFIVDRAREKTYREQADAAARGDASALAKVIEDAKRGDAVAQAELGRLYSLGRGVAKDEKLAYEWTERAAQQGFPRAIFNLGVHFEIGGAVETDLRQAVELYRRATEKGFARAQLALGLLYRTGKGVPQDFQESLKLITSAANQHLPAAELALAEIYDAGAGVMPDAPAADMWLSRARSQQYQPATLYLQERQKRKAELAAMARASPASAKASATAVDKAELDRRLLEAVKKANVEYVRELLDAGADINVSDETRGYYGETPLHQAARTGNIELAKLLIARGADVNVAGPTGFVPLHIAAGIDQRAMVEYLISAGANTNALDRNGTPLHVATLQGHAAIVSLLLSKGANPNARRPNDGYAPLHMYSMIAQYFASHTKIIEALVRHGADINAKDTAGRTPLDRANDKAIPALIVAGALPSKSDSPFDLLSRAAESGRREPLEYLEGSGHALTARSAKGDTLLHVAAHHADAAALDYLLRKQVDVHIANDVGETPLYAAVSACRKSNAERLIKHGARVNDSSPEGITPLHAVLVRGWPVDWERCEDAIHLLLAAGANPRIRDKEGRTPLHVVAEQQRLLERVLQAGGDPNARDKDGRTPLHVFSYYGKRPAAVATLVRAGADPNAQDSKGRTPLHLFSEWGAGGERLDVARALLRSGARVDIRDSDGQTAIEAYEKTPWGERSDGREAAFVKLLRGEPCTECRLPE